MVVQGDCQEVPFRSEQFDLVLARSLLHHLPDPQAGLAEIHRVLRPGGQVILSDTNYSLLSALPRRLAYRGRNFSAEHKNLHRAEYVRWFQRYFELERITYFGYIAYPFGFPDIMGPFRHIHFPTSFIKGLIVLDRVLSVLPGIRTQSWGIMLAGAKRDKLEG
jgi:SAM-dependent methyltransferase